MLFIIFERDNLLRVVIFYDNMSYERLEQVPSYDTLVWLGKSDYYLITA